jgi:hypothetical protein
MVAQLSLYDDPTLPLPLSGDIAEQLRRLDVSTRVWLDHMLDLGFELEVIGDWTAESRRITAANRYLRPHIITTARGRRRGWMRPVHPGERGWLKMGDPPVWWTFVGYEPRLEKQIGAGRRTPHESTKARHWPKGATP